MMLLKPESELQDPDLSKINSPSEDVHVHIYIYIYIYTHKPTCTIVAVYTYSYMSIYACMMYAHV